MNTLTLNNISLDGGNVIIKKGNNTGGGNGGSTAPVSKGDVTFYDYDGTVLHSYTKDEFLALSAMPNLPERKGLICQEWNWSFEDAIAYVSKYGILDVGATYITDDGKTRLYIRIAAKGRMDVPLYFSQTVANGVVIDWGDGSETQTLGGTGNVNTTHKYAGIGDYVITLDSVDECKLGFGHGVSSYSVMGSTLSAGKAYCNMLQNVKIGNGVTSIGNNAFYNCYSLTSIVIPQSITSMGDNAFFTCYSLSSIIIPQGVTSINVTAFADCRSLTSIVIPQSVTNFVNNAFTDCHSLSSIIIPQGITSIKDYMFQNCYSLTSIVIPNDVTSIKTYVFYNCRAIAFYDFSTHTAVPTISATSAFQNIASDCKIIVPDALYDEWIAATNWSTYASQIIKKSDWDASQA